MSERERMQVLVDQLARAAIELSGAWEACSDETAEVLSRSYPSGVPCLRELATVLANWEVKP